MVQPWLDSVIFQRYCSGAMVVLWWNYGKNHADTSSRVPFLDGSHHSMMVRTIVLACYHPTTVL